MITNRHGTAFLLFLLALPAAAAEGGSPLDGSWQAWYTQSQSKAYGMEIANGTFHAVHGEQWYKGEIVLDEEAVPARVDFAIHECDCGFAGKTSAGIFRWDGDVVEIRAPEPGKPRPTEFDEESGETMRLVRRAR